MVHGIIWWYCFQSNIVSFDRSTVITAFRTGTQQIQSRRVGSNLQDALANPRATSSRRIETRVARTEHKAIAKVDIFSVQYCMNGGRRKNDRLYYESHVAGMKRYHTDFSLTLHIRQFLLFVDSSHVKAKDRYFSRRAFIGNRHIFHW